MTAASRAQVADASASIAGLVTGCVGLVVLLASAVDATTLTRILPAWPRMSPATAFCFILAGTSLALLASPAPSQFAARIPWRRALGYLSAAVAALLASGRVVEYLLGRPTLIDGFPLSLTAPGPHGAMALATALSLSLLGWALLVLYHGRHPLVAQGAAITALLIGWLGLSGYVYGGAPLQPHASMSLHAAVLLLLLSTGTLAAVRDAGLVALLTRDSAGAASARHLLPPAILLPLLVAWIPLYAQHEGWVSPEAGLSLFALSTVMCFAGLVWVSAQRLDRTDRARQDAQAALQQSAEHTHLILENALDAVITMSADGKVTGWNRQATAIFGWTSEEAVGRLLADTIVPLRHRAAHYEGLHRYLSTGEARVLNRRVELFGLHKAGHEFPVELSIVPLRISDGVGFSAFIRDITARVQAEAALRDSENRLRTLAESLPHLVWTCRPDGWCDYLSRQWLEYTGLDEGSQLGSGWALQLHPDDRQRVQREWATASSLGGNFDTEFRIRRYDGVYRWFKTRAVALRDSSGAIVKWFGSNTDCEDHKQAESRLRAQLERMSLLDETTRAIGDRQDLRSIFQVVLHRLETDLPVDFGCICLHDQHAQVLRVSCIGVQSAALAAQLGLEELAEVAVDANGLAQCVRGQLVHERNITGSLHPFPQRLAQAGLGALVIAPLPVEGKVFGVIVAARRTPESFTSGECEFLRQLGSHVALAAHQVQLYGSLQRAYDDLRRSQQSVIQQERLRALGQMASGVAHDINNALSPAAIYAQSLLEHASDLSDDARRQLDTIHRAIGDAARTVARLRDFARQEAGTETPQPLDLNRTVTEVLELTRARWSDMPMERGQVVQVVTELAPALPPVSGVPNEIRDGLINLILNAVDAMPEGGVLAVRSRYVAKGSRERKAPSGLVQVEVVDTGIGMDETTRIHCLEPFFSTKGERGTGLGLAMVFGMAERHGAEIDIESEPGRGTTIRLSFPTTVEAPRGVEPTAMEPRAVASLRVLVIDDDLRLLTPLHNVLEHQGHSVVAAEGGEAGIAAYLAAAQAGEPFDVVITDLGMPRVDGRQVALAIKGHSPDVPIILLTGWGHGLDHDEHIEGVDRILSKPPNLSELRAALADLTGGAGS